jgi:hypothetical protein
VHTSTSLELLDLRELDGVPVTSAARTLLDPQGARRALRRALGTGNV